MMGWGEWLKERMDWEGLGVDGMKDMKYEFVGELAKWMMERSEGDF